MSVKDNFPALKPSLLLDFANTKVLDPRVTFSRASTATFYDGKTVAKAEENLLLYSQEFDNAAWTKNGSTITANATTAPDGTTTADLIYPTSTGTARWVYRTLALASGVYTRSVYAKAQNKSILYIDANGSGTIVTYFNLSTGAVGTVAAGYTATITDVGGGWYRCTIKNDSAAAFSFGAVFGVADADGSISVTANGTDGIYLWGAQLEQRSTVTAYTPTTTQPITNYIPVLQTAQANTARFDHNPVTGESLGLRIEEQRTNLLTYSEQFDNAAWTKYNSSIVANSAVAPDGTQTADTIVEGTLASDNVLLTQSVSKAASAITYTLSAMVKTGGRNIRLYADGNSVTNRALVDFDLSTGTLIGSASVSGTFTAASAAIVNIGNGWYRCSLTFTSDTATTMRNRMYLLNGTNATYTGNGYSGIYIWGAQLEAGSFATSYIPTSASQVTRSADSASMTGTNFSSFYNTPEGTVYSEFALLSAAGNNRVVVDINEPSGTQGSTRTDIYANQNTGTGAVLLYDTAGSALLFTTAAPVGGTSLQKIALAYAIANIAAAQNGLVFVTNTSSSGMRQKSVMYIGSAGTGFASPLNGYIKKLAYYPIRCTNTQLQALTQG